MSVLVAPCQVMPIGIWFGTFGPLIAFVVVVNVVVLFPVEENDAVSSDR